MAPAKMTRLDSWKAIADYLGRNSRTVTRWADGRGMPVHRLPGGKRNAVFAYTSEIDAWLVSRKKSTGGNLPPDNSVPFLDQSVPFDEIDPSTVGQGGRKHAFTPYYVKNKWVLLAAALCFVGIVWGIKVLVSRTHAFASARTGSLVRLTDDGKNKHNLRGDGVSLYFNEIQGIRQVLMATTIRGGSIHQIATPFSNVFLRDVSHDGKNLLVTSFEGLEYEQPLWIISTQGGMPQKVGNAICHSAQWSPTESEIACATQNRIVILDVDGTVRRSVGSFPAPPISLTWSPDGTRIRFVMTEPSSGIDSSWEIVVSKDSRDVPAVAHRLSFVNDCCREWGWTQDGKSFVYIVRPRSEKSSLIIESHLDQALDSSPPRVEIPIGIGKVDSLAPGKNDREIYILISGSWRGELLKLDPQRNTLETFLHGISACYLSFSHDGQWISYVNTVDDSLWRSRVDGSDALRLTPASMVVELPSWSPDGSQLAFTALKPGKPWRVFLVGRDGLGLREASTGDDNQGAPTWSPDGKSLTYANIECHDVHTCGVHRIELDSGNLIMVPESEGFRTARWSPDGRFIAALRPQTHHLMMYELSSQRWKALADSVTGDDISWSSDSRYIYVDSPQSEKPIIERIRVKDGNRTTVGSLSLLQVMPGNSSMWFGLTPDDSIILLHFVNTTEVYALDGTD